MAPDDPAADSLLHAGAGTAIVIGEAFVLIPALLPSLALAGLIAAVALIPLIAVGVAATLAAAPPYGVWRLVSHRRRPRRRPPRLPRSTVTAQESR